MADHRNGDINAFGWCVAPARHRAVLQKTSAGIIWLNHLCAEFIMQRTSRTPPVVAIDNIDDNVVRLQRRGAAAIGDGDASLPVTFETLPALMERASNAARQIRYFGLATKRFPFEELIPSARRAGFFPLEQNLQLKEAKFRWAAGEPDLIFSISFGDPARISIVAESQADIFGLILTAFSHIPTISVETSPTLENKELGRNALLFRDMLLTFPDFDDMPAWTKYPEKQAPEIGGLVGMWRDGVSVASVVGRTWESISARVSSGWETFRDRWLHPR
jgi:hypothetical protein